MTIEFNSNGCPLSKIVSKEGAKGAQKAQKAIYECLVQFHFKNFIQGKVLHNEVAENFNTRKMTFSNWTKLNSRYELAAAEVE